MSTVRTSMAAEVPRGNGWVSRRAQERLQRVVLTAILACAALLTLMPLAWMLSTSFKPEVDVYRWPIQWIPSRPRLDNYREVWLGQHPFWLYYLNSVKVSTLRVLGDLITASLAAYGFARLRFPGRDALFLLYLSTMIIPPQVLLVPRFILFRWLGIYNTHWAVVLPHATTPFGTFLLRQFFMAIPNELSEAARIDGATEFQIYSRIILPLAKPALASLAILAFTWAWNDYENPLVMLSNDQLYTVTLGLTKFMDEAGNVTISRVMAASVSSILPIFTLFLFLQRYFIEALSRSGLRG